MSRVSNWTPMSKPIDVKHLGKLAEEFGECSAAVSRCLIQGVDEHDPVTGKVNRDWLQIGSNAPTEKRGAPNPEFACWLMGWPDALTYGALRAIQLFLPLRRKLSRRSPKLSTPANDNSPISKESAA